MALKKGIGSISLYGGIYVSVFTDYDMDIFMSPTFNAYYNRGEFIELPNYFYFKLDFSKIPNNIDRLTSSTIFGLLFKNINGDVDITEIDFKMTGETGVSYNVTLNNYENNISKEKNVYYLSDKNDVITSSRSEEYNFGNLPNNMTEGNAYTFRTDIDTFEYPFFDVYQCKKILDYSCGLNSIYDVKSNYNWLFSDNKGLNFNPIVSGGTPISITGMVNTIEGLSVISDVNGVLKIYSDGLTVYNGKHQIMGNGTGLNGYSSATQSVLIVPQPNTTKYYIFNSSVSGVSQGLNYSIADISINNGEGFLINKNSILLNSPITEKLAASTSYNNEDYWIVTHTSGDSKFYSYLLSNSGLTGPVISNVGSIHNDMIGYLKISNDGSKLACALYNQDIIDLFDFDITGGTVTNPITLSGITYNKGPYGLEFSNDSSKLYITDGADTNIYQLDITYTSATEIENSIITITDQALSLGAMQMAPDGRIYVIDKGLGGLHRINETNRKGFYCSYEPMYLSGLSNTQIGLPNAIAGEYNNCSRSVFNNKLDREKYTFNFHFNDDNNVIYNKKLDFRSEIYKYDKSLGVFNDIAVFSSSTFVYSAITNGETNSVNYYCPSGYTITPANDNCQKITTTGATLNGTLVTATTATLFASYGSGGSLFYESVDMTRLPIGDTGINGPFNYNDGTGTTLTYSVVGSGSTLWGVTPNGRLSIAGIDIPASETLGFTHCLDIPNSGTYTLGIAANNLFKLSINGVVLVNADTWWTNFWYWHVFPIELTSGLNIIEMVGIDSGGGGGFAAEIYSATTAQLSAMTTTTQLEPYIVFTSRDKIGDVLDIGTTNGYSCPSGFALNACDNTYTCTKIEETNVITNIINNKSEITFDTNLSVLGEGEFIIKGYYDFPITTFTMGSLNRRSSNYLPSKSYGYNGDTDWYFINLYESEKPIFNNAAGTTSNTPQNGLIVRSQYITSSGQTKFSINGGTPSNNVVVAYNGSVLSTNEYTFTDTLITILSGTTTPVPGDIITYFYLPITSEGTYNPNYKYEGYTVNTITSGVTDNQSITTKIYYNTDKNKYEYYLDSAIGGGDIVFIVNGSTLINNVEYYQSTSNDKRIILETDIYIGDIIEVFYYSRTTFIGSIDTNIINIGWSITNPPISGITGEFILQMSPSGDYDFNTIVYSANTNYVVNQTTYSSNINITGGTIGDSYLYRVKNIKKYQPIIGVEIESINYSDIIPITINSNAINSY